MLIVRKPFNSIDSENKLHPEYEEKPIQATSFVSEETHGGNELTFSLPQPQHSSEPNDSSISEATSNDIAESVTEQSNENSADVEQNNNSTSSRTDNQLEPSKQQQSERDSEHGENAVENKSSTSEQSSKEHAEGSESYGNDEDSEDSESSSVDEEDTPEGSGEEDSVESASYQYNTQQVVDVAGDVDSSTKYYQTEFYRFIEMIAEEKTKVYDYKNAEEYNVKKLMFRQFERKPLNHYRMARVRDTVILILDNSGSMEWWAENLQILADIALQRSDVEVYIAPNGYVENKLIAGGRSVEVSHEAFMKTMKGRRIIYVGDFDGANTAVALSFGNEVVWICPESRYKRFKSHSWVSYEEEDFRGAFLRVYDLDEMFYALRRLLAHQHINRIWIDLHEDDRFEDD